MIINTTADWRLICRRIDAKVTVSLCDITLQLIKVERHRETHTHPQRQRLMEKEMARVKERWRKRVRVSDTERESVIERGSR